MPRSPPLAHPSTTVYPQPLPSTLPILLKYINAYAFNLQNPSKGFLVPCLLDDGSTHSYILNETANKLNLLLSPSHNQPQFGVFGNPKYVEPTNSFTTQFGIKLKNGRDLTIHATTLDFLTHPMPYIPLLGADLNTIPLETFIEMGSPAILLGSDIYYELEPTTIGRLPNGYTLIHTLLGPIIAGKAHPSPIITKKSEIQNTFFVSSCSDLPFTSLPTQTDDPNTSISHLFSLENLGIETPTPIHTAPQEGDAVLDNFNKTVKMVDNRYQVDLPFRSDPSHLILPSNYGLCWGRLRSALNSLSKDPSLLAKYNQIIMEQLQLGVIEHAPSNFFPPLHYLPHHPIIKPSKLRIVYDGSARSSRDVPSLNDVLFPGPPLMADIVGMLIRFRLPLIAITCDVAKAFLQISVNPSHRDCTRFLWIKDISKPLSPDNMVTYRFTRVSFGLTCSPFLLAATIKNHLQMFDSPLCPELDHNIYVDNILLYASSPQDGQTKCSEVIKIFEAASMPLREFVSNSQESISLLPKTYRLPAFQQKFLGLGWDTNTDYLSIDIPLPDFKSSPTKRSVLSFIASIFDPMGLVSPLLVPLKIFFQSLWAIKPALGWDQNLSSSLTEQFRQLLFGWENTKISFPRQVLSNLANDHILQLHAFSDASNIAFATVIYLRGFSPSQEVGTTSLLFSKVKVKPKSKFSNLTIPRLELLGVTIAVRALQFVHTQLSLSPGYSFDKCLHVWTDSSTVLNWMNSKEQIKDVFVANRIKEIRAISSLQIRHIPGAINPADLPTRGIASPSALQTHTLWWRGPEWLSLPSSQWPTHSIVKNFSSTEFHSPRNGDHPSSSLPLFSFHVNEPRTYSPIIDLSRFSRLPRALRVTALSLRAIGSWMSHQHPDWMTLRYPNFHPSHSLSPSLSELSSAHLLLLRQEQSLFPPAQPDNEALGLFMDGSGLWRCKGRLEKSELHIKAKYPIFIPPQSEFTRLLVYETHILALHASPMMTLSLLRGTYWIPRGRRTVMHILHKTCLPCRRFSARPFNLPAFPPLPFERVNASPPFTYTGLDHCGPIRIRTELISHSNSNPCNKPKFAYTKIWICVWVCLSTRAVHLDASPDLSTPSFLENFRRFVALFDPKTIYCDNEPTFRLAKKVLEVHAKDLPSSFLQITWNFRAPLAAWKGGHYERLMALIKHHLKRCLCRGIFPSIFSYNSILTALQEISLIINSRPITYDSSNPANPRPLAPINFLQPLREFNPFPLPPADPRDDPNFNPLPKSDPSHLLSLWSKLTESTRFFWRKWRLEYLAILRERHKKLPISTQRHPQPGELVLLYDAASPQSTWVPALIISIQNNALGEPDTATVRLNPHKVGHPGHVVLRSIHHLYPLETSEEIFSHSPITLKQPEQGQNSQGDKPEKPKIAIKQSTPGHNPDVITLRNRNITRQQ